jgi:hypothetical protein
LFEKKGRFLLKQEESHTFEVDEVKGKLVIIIVNPQSYDALLNAICVRCCT